MLNRESHNSIHLQIADFVYYQVPLVSLSALSALPFAVALQILAERYIEVAAAKALITICIINLFYKNLSKNINEVYFFANSHLL